MYKKILVKKASGDMEEFSEDKLRFSLERINTSQKSINKIIAHVASEIKDGDRTEDIYKHTFSLLRDYERNSASRYSLKRAIFELGPSGFPFEKLVGELLKAEGFSIETDVMVQGLCVTHEVDAVGERDDKHVMVECKFHNQAGAKTDVKITLYVQARFEDIEKAWKKQLGHSRKLHEAWLVTNTKLTSDAIAYAACVGMKAIGWSYPPGESLEERIERSGLHPVTCLTTLNNLQKRQLIDNGIVLCKQVLENEQLLRRLLSSNETDRVKQEVFKLCKTK